MKIKPLNETNPYLTAPHMREKLVERSVASSSGVEGIRVDFRKTSASRIIRSKDKKIYKRAH